MDTFADRIEIVHSAAPGRLRLRCPVLRGNPALAARLQGLLGADPRLERVEARPLTGSIILHFDSGADGDPLIDAVREAAAVAASTEPQREEGAHATGPAWHSLAAGEVERMLQSDAQVGLSAAEAASRLGRHGPNLLPQEEQRSRLSLLAEQFNSLPVALLAGSAAVSLATGGVADAAATLAVVAMNGVIGYVTEGQAESAIHALMDTSGQSVTVRRDGQALAITASALVPGDLVLVRPGSQIAADARLVAARRLLVDESALTGETMPVEKRPDAGAEIEAPIGARPGLLHSGTIVAEGVGRAIVVATGSQTAAARIALLSQRASRPRAPIEVELDRLGTILVKGSLALCGLFFGIGWLRGYGLSAILKDALALAVASVPEGLPMVATTTMALGLKRMQRRGILVRRIDAIESLGAIQTICLDKTGTLTQNRMQVVEAVAGTSRAALDDRVALRQIGEAAALNNDCDVTDGTVSGSSATERALMEFAVGAGIDAAGLRASRARQATIARGARRQWMATIHGGAGPSTVVKGAPAAVLQHCTRLRDAGTARPLTDADRQRILALNDAVAARPARAIAFAHSTVVPEGDGVRDLTWLGLVGMTDPLRPGSKAFVKSLHAAGIETVMITGDQAATAGALARELNLSHGASLRIIDSTEVSGLDPDLLAGLARQAHVFARVSADQKLAVVQALQSAGRVVAMTGDGVNDGPALKAADIGIAMGASGTDLARDVANVVIRDDELTTLIDAIAQGRSIYRNIRRALEFLVTTNMSEIVVGLAEAVHGPAELETPMELLWINVVSDVLPGLGLALADPDEDAMQRPPRRLGDPVIPAHDLRRMSIDSGMIATSALVSHFTGLVRHGPGPETRGMTFLSLSLAQLLYTIVCQRSDVRKLRPDRLLENRALDLAVLTSIGLAILPFLAPGPRRLLGIAPLRPLDLAVSLTAAAAPSVAVLARRGIQLVLEDLESGPCETS